MSGEVGTTPGAPAVLRVDDVSKSYRVRGPAGRTDLVAVDRVSLQVREGETFALVGESGCGKSTLARCAAMLTRPSAGTVEWSGRTVSTASSRALRGRRGHTQLVFQDAASALSPRFTVAQCVAEPLEIQDRPAGRATVEALLDDVGLASSLADRHPHELSGGQRQRVVIARALALQPQLLVLDEPVASLDVSVQAAVLNLLSDLQERHGFAYLFIAHDLAVVSSVADRLAVMYLGRLVEEGAAADVMTAPRHPYTRMLIEAVPAFDPADRRARTEVRGDPPSPTERHRGCPFVARCPLATALCVDVPPPPRPVGGSVVRCHHAEQVAPPARTVT